MWWCFRAESKSGATTDGIRRHCVCQQVRPTYSCRRYAMPFYMPCPSTCHALLYAMPFYMPCPPCQTPRFYFLISYYIFMTTTYMLKVYCLPNCVCLVTFISLEQCLQFERSHPSNIQTVNKISSFKTKLSSNDALASRVSSNSL